MRESAAKYFQRLVIMNKNGDYTLTASYDSKVVKQLFEEYDCTIVKAPKSLHQSCIITFYRNNDPNNLMVAHLDRFCEDPNQSFNKSKSKLLVKENTEKPINKVREQQRLEKEVKLRESMKSEDCEIISKYVNCDTKVFYIHDGNEYQTTPYRWNSGYRAHQSKCPRYTQNHIKKMFEDEGCELISEYKNQKSKLKYRYQGVVYEVVFNDWKFFNSRPHLGRRSTYHDVYDEK
ncbi:hypothetical protein M9Y10_006630 [Tritrichomonas musculus]|uniref:Uncharacterized protein n=1 Tax=Tritrichomonas musculus TaxID=1915356 RepID=A0ABR2JFT1_9EUKA